MSKIKKIVDELKEHGSTELELVDKSIVNILDIPGICECYLHLSEVVTCLFLMH